MHAASVRDLRRHQRAIRALHLRDLFARDPGRAERFSLEVGDLFLDYSKNRITPETLRLLLRLATASGLRPAIRDMFAGRRINVTENRAVLHVALRNRSNTPIRVDGQDVMPEVNAVLARMRTFARKVRSGAWLGYTGRRIRNIVNIGIGGSDLGPAIDRKSVV